MMLTHKNAVAVAAASGAESVRASSKDSSKKGVVAAGRTASKSTAYNTEAGIIQARALDEFIPTGRRTSVNNPAFNTVLRATLAQRKHDEETTANDAKKRWCNVGQCNVFESMSTKAIDFVELCQSKHGKGVNWAELPVAEQVDLVRDALKSRIYVIDPGSEYMKFWDMVVGICLVFTALVTPFEIAFLKPSQELVIAVINRLVDIVFVKDMAMQFFLKVQKNTRQGKVWVRDRGQVARLYFKTWFFIDLLSIVPYDDITNNVTAEGMSKLKIFRTIRVLRLFKLARILKASRLVKRWENRIAFRSTHIYLIKFSILIVLSLAIKGTSLECANDLSPDDPRRIANPTQRYFFRDTMGNDPYNPILWDGDSWVVRFAAGRAAETVTDPCDSSTVYIAAMYWAVMTMTSVGYGDILPHTPSEYIVCTVCMMASSIVWAYIIGTACAVMSNMDPEQTDLERRLDDFNSMARDQDLPRHIRYRGREFIREQRFHEHYIRHMAAWESLGADLRGTVARQIASVYINNIWFFKGTSAQFREDTAKMFLPNFYEKRELIENPSKLCVVERGAVGRQGRILVPWNYWGEDMLVRLEMLRDDHSAMTLTHTEIMTLHRDDLSEVALSYPAETKRLRHAAVLMAIYRLSKMYSQELNSGNRRLENEWIHAIFEQARKIAKIDANQHIFGSRELASARAEASMTSIIIDTIAEDENAPPPIGEARLTLEAKVDDIRKDMKGILEAGGQCEPGTPGCGPQTPASQRNLLLFRVLEKLESIEERLEDGAQGRVTARISGNSICNSHESSRTFVPPINGSPNLAAQSKYISELPINGSRRSSPPPGSLRLIEPQGFAIAQISHAGSSSGVFSEPAEPTVPPEPLFLDDKDFGLSFGFDQSEGCASFGQPAQLLTKASQQQPSPTPPDLDSLHLSRYQELDSQGDASSIPVSRV
eukprot:TRINITY_DN6174_c0_g1_i1.p1 TRINITY_DN6174_c0_g1~~TRINITY_DN6174_c0_g1_i1.p1  ORF type:complete len:939 (-),score=131.57 TRINITY_DN6174_c0_g1_i1:150-2966(-)